MKGKKHAEKVALRRYLHSIKFKILNVYELLFSILIWMFYYLFVWENWEMRHLHTGGSCPVVSGQGCVILTVLVPRWAGSSMLRQNPAVLCAYIIYNYKLVILLYDLKLFILYNIIFIITTIHSCQHGLIKLRESAWNEISPTHANFARVCTNASKMLLPEPHIHILALTL